MEIVDYKGFKNLTPAIEKKIISLHIYENMKIFC